MQAAKRRANPSADSPDKGAPIAGATVDAMAAVDAVDAFAALDAVDAVDAFAAVAAFVALDPAPGPDGSSANAGIAISRSATSPVLGADRQRVLVTAEKGGVMRTKLACSMKTRGAAQTSGSRVGEYNEPP